MQSFIKKNAYAILVAGVVLLLGVWIYRRKKAEAEAFEYLRTH